MISKEDKLLIETARKYGLEPGSMKCEIFRLFDQGYSRREVRYLLRQYKVLEHDPSFSNTIRKYYYLWKQKQRD